MLPQVLFRDAVAPAPGYDGMLQEKITTRSAHAVQNKNKKTDRSDAGVVYFFRIFFQFCFDRKSYA